MTTEPLPDVGTIDPLAAAGEGIRAYCHWHIAPVITTTIKRPYLYVLPTLKLVAIDSIVIDGTTLVEGTDYEWYENGVVDLASCWRYRDKPVTVTFQHGFAETPLAVAAVMKSTVKRLARGGAGQVTTGPFQPSFPTPSGQAASPDDFTSYEKMVLAPFVLPEGS